MTPEHIADLAADLCDRAAKILREDHVTRRGYTIAGIAQWLSVSEDPERDYRCALGERGAGLTPAEIDAAVDAIKSKQAMKAPRALVLAHLDAGHESTLDHISKTTGVPVLDVLVIINDEAKAKRVECVGGSRLWRRVAGKAVL